jgi:ElaB/YqjD/DUF883 family membrane-anchored ribosome-binding protein
MTDTKPTSANDGAAGSKPHAIRDGIDNARDQVSSALHSAGERTKDGIDQARGAVSDAYASGRDKAVEVYEGAKDRARAAGKSAADGIEHSPLAAVLGGVALGVVIGALLPRTQREAQVLGSVGEKLQGLAKEAVSAARDAGQEKLDELGLSKDKARDTAKSLIDAVIAAAGSAGTAALDTTKAKTSGTGKTA